MSLEQFRTLYKKQVDSINSVVFKCKNGKIKRCSRWILKQSLFFTEKLNACDRFGNETEFDYEEFNIEAIECFLASLHGTSYMIPTKVLIRTQLELLIFLKAEGKTDVSPFESQLYEKTKQKMRIIKMSPGTRILFSFFDQEDLKVFNI